MKLIAIIGTMLASAFLLFVVVINFSSVELRFQCSGDLYSHGDTTPANVYLKLENYRWWVGLWSESDGSLTLEIPGKSSEYFAGIVEVGDQLQIYESDWESRGVKGMRGYFSTLSKTLGVSTSAGVFEGACKPIE